MRTSTQKLTVDQIFRRRQRIDLDPIFQREKVWKLPKQQYLIDTIIKGWGIPKIYLAVNKDSRGEENFVCIDGKQRLNAIFAFLTNGFKLSPAYTPALKDKSYRKLPMTIRDKVNRFPLTIERVSDATDQELGELFKRLQLGVSLNSAEKLKADATNITRFVSNLTKQEFFKNKVSFQNTRGAFFAVAAQLCLLEMAGRIVSAKYNNLERFFKDYSNFDNNGLDAKRIKKILAYLSKMFKKGAPELSNRANAISIYLLISELMKRGDIKGKEAQLGTFFRKFVSDLRTAVSDNKMRTEPEFLRYQNATIQSADSLASIKIRHDILVEKLVNSSTYFKKLLNAPTEEQRFKVLYDKMEKKHGGKPSVFDAWLQQTYAQVPKTKCRTKIESLPVHVRNAIHHKDHPKYTKPQLKKALDFLLTIS